MSHAATVHALAFPGGTIAEMVLPWETIPKHRHRTNDGRTYSPDADAEAATAWELVRQFRHSMLLGPFALTVHAFRETARAVDIDNLCKHILDAGNKVLWKDDSQCVGLLGIKSIDRDNPRTIVCLSSWEAP